ncbi:hypothetical protein JCM10213v2_007402 [Rhodosporidiobolus nylandii]
MSSVSTSLRLPKSASAADLAASFSLSGAWSSSDPSPASVLAASTDSSSSLNGATAFPLLEADWAASGTGAPNTEWVVDPFDGGNGEEVLQVAYPVDTREGTQFSMDVFRNYTSEWNQTVQTALLKYEVAFSNDFDFVKGGKLPGLYGQNDDATGTCSGGNRDADCFSARLMWRQRGAGEVYAYLPTYAKFCQQSDVICNSDYGISLSRGSFQFKPGGWTTITQLVSLNTPGTANGLLYLYCNDTLALAHTGLAWRTRDDVTLTSVLFSTFFGGSDSSWDARGGSAYFRRFEAYASPLSSNTTGPAVNASTTGGFTSSSPPSQPTPFFAPLAAAPCSSTDPFDQRPRQTASTVNMAPLTSLLPLFLVSLLALVAPATAQYDISSPLCIRSCYDTMITRVNNGEFPGLTTGDTVGRCRSGAFGGQMMACWNDACDTAAEIASGKSTWSRTCAWVESTMAQMHAVQTSAAEKAAATVKAKRAPTAAAHLARRDQHPHQHPQLVKRSAAGSLTASLSKTLAFCVGAITTAAVVFFFA